MAERIRAPLAAETTPPARARALRIDGECIANTASTVYPLRLVTSPLVFMAKAGCPYVRNYYDWSHERSGDAVRLSNKEVYHLIGRS